MLRRFCALPFGSLSNQWNNRHYSTTPTPPNTTAFVNQRAMNAAFAEAREAIQDARESVDTVYYSDDYADATQITKQALDMYKSHLAECPTEEERNSLKAEFDLKMGQLREELEQLGTPH